MSKRVRKAAGRPSKPEIRVVVGVPLERTVPDVSFLHFWEIARRGYPLIHRGYSRTDSNRNEFGRIFLESEFTHLCMLDLDHKHPPDIVERLARWVMADRDKFQVVAALAFRRTEPFNPCVYAHGPDGHLHYPVEWTQGIAQVQAVGHAAVLIDRRVLEKLPPPWWQYEYLEWGSEYPTEDMHFCRLCREAEIPIWCDMTTVTPHLGSHDIGEATFRAYLKAHPLPAVPANEEGAS